MKDRIDFHRSYRTLESPDAGHVVGFVMLVVPVELLLLLLQTRLLPAFAGAAREALLWCGIPAHVIAVPFLPFVVQTLYVVDAALPLPDPGFAFANLLAAFLVVTFLPRVRFVPRALLVYIVFLSLLNAASSLFFLLIPAHFPYDMVSFSILYVEVEVVLWFLMPLVMAILLTTLPDGIGEKLLVVLVTTLYSIVFGVVRYATFLYLLSKASALYMAALYFALGPLLDFVYIVAIYSLYTSIVAKRLKREQQRRWLWSS